MKPNETLPPATAPVDTDLADQARSGHGIPSQDTDAAAQLPLNPEEAEREANSVLAGGGVMVGAAAGAAIGVVLAGPVGAVVAGTAGAVVGALGGVAAGPLLKREDEDKDASGATPADKGAPGP